jgi:hypothetical protein
MVVVVQAKNNFYHDRLSTNMFLSSCRGFQVLTSMDRRVFSSMCQHDVRSEGHQKPSSFNFAHIL